MGQIQQQEQHHQVAPQEVAFQESMIAEREGEIREIESGIHELNEIFRDLGTIVVEQGGMLGELLRPFLDTVFAVRSTLGVTRRLTWS